ncbi:isochorismatase family protein [Blastococcus haudaquaticus]|uniref:Nicotinamidase-related amidase n=1 Tax=Blastococcus haudaquaticus TaxID=1938745 RepID=A0A286GGW6_9ACTN|nr:isochorismatase family protein [Blastococcus haudaquaticus]SOD94761.1 Nicotinamidase-related amidase [Blastococcus haudaquaticus]
MEPQYERHCWDDVIGDDERLVMTRYRPRPPGRRPALLLIDCYRKVFGDRPQPLAEAIEKFPSSCGLAGWAALPHLEELLTRARAAGVPVLHTTGDARVGVPGGGVTQRAPVPGHDDAAGLEFVEPLRPREGEIVVRKSCASAFFGTPLATWLRDLDVDTLVVAGETTSGCVRATTVDACSAGYRVVVVEEATFDRSPLSHKMSLFDLSLKYASVVHTDRALQVLDAGPG